MVAQCSSVRYSGSDGRYDTGRDALQILGPCRDRAGRVTEWNSSPLRCLWEFAIPTGGTWRRGAADVPPHALTPNPLYGHYKVVEVALLGHGRPRVPVVLEEDGVDAILAEASEPIESCLLGLQVVVDPELENAVGQPVSFNRACASTQYHWPTWLASKSGVTPGFLPSQWKCAKSLYRVVWRFPSASVPDTGSSWRAFVSGESPPHRWATMASTHSDVTMLLARVSL